MPKKHSRRSKKLAKKEFEKAIKLSKKFFGFDPRRVSEIEIDKMPRTLVHLGQCSQVNYISDKYDGEFREYFHMFEGSSHLFTPAEPVKRGMSMLIILGDFKIKADGIVG